MSFTPLFLKAKTILKTSSALEIISLELQDKKKEVGARVQGERFLLKFIGFKLRYSRSSSMKSHFR